VIDVLVGGDSSIVLVGEGGGGGGSFADSGSSSLLGGGEGRKIGSLPVSSAGATSSVVVELNIEEIESDHQLEEAASSIEPTTSSSLGGSVGAGSES